MGSIQLRMALPSGAADQFGCTLPLALGLARGSARNPWPNATTFKTAESESRQMEIFMVLYLLSASFSCAGCAGGQYVIEVNSEALRTAGICSSGIGLASNNFRQGTASQRAKRVAFCRRALSVEMPVFAYI